VRPNSLPFPRVLLPVALIALALLAVAAPAGAAKKAVPCWKLVLQDSFTGRFDTIYKHSCYTQAIARIPTADLIYSNTREEIEAASAAAAGKRTYTSQSVSSTGNSTVATPSISGGSHGVPTAIIVLGGVAVALLLVGGAGEFWRRRRNS
jgi:hypothetical protein